MRTGLAIKREILKYLREYWIDHNVNYGTGNLQIASAFLSFDNQDSYVTIEVPTAQRRHVSFYIMYQGFDKFFVRFTELYEAHPYRSYLKPIVVRPKPKMSKRKAVKAPAHEIKAIAA